MIFTRLLSIILRAAQFVFAVVVLGLTAYFLHERTKHGVGPFARLIYAIVWSSLSIIFSVVWMIPTKSTIASYGSDLRKSPPSYSAPTFLPLTYSSLHSRLGRCLRRASDLVQRRRVRQRVGLGRPQLESQ